MKKRKFEYICADCSGKSNTMFPMDHSYGYDCHDTCIVWENFTFYGVPTKLSDEQMNEIYEGNYANAVKIGSLFGCMILCKQILSAGEDPYIVCDDVNGDLEFVMSALQDPGEPLDIDPEQDIFYIHDFEMDPDYKDLKLKARILDEIPGLAWTFFHVAPDIIAFIPTPLEHEPDPEKEERNAALAHIASQKLDGFFNKESDSPSAGETEKIVQFGAKYSFTEEELNILMGRRNADAPAYPDRAKNKGEFDFYKANGFEEVGNSKLLYKLVEIE